MSQKVKKSTRHKSTRRKKKTAKRRPQRRKKKTTKRKPLPISGDEVKSLGFNYELLIDAASAVSLRSSLTKLIEKHPKLELAWKWGQFLRNLRQIAQTPVTVSEAAKKLGLETGQELREILDSQPEAADIWEQTRLNIFIEAKAALFEAAKGGNQAAIKVIGKLLEEEQIAPTASLERLTTNQLVELTGKSRQTIHEWQVKFGLPRNSDKTFNLHDFFPWFEDFVERKASKGKETTGMDPWKSLRAERLKLDLAKQKHQLLDRVEVMAGLLARHQILITWSGQKAEELGRLCQGQKPERIAEILKEAITELRRQLCQVPAELQLPAGSAELFQKTLESIK